MFNKGFEYCKPSGIEKVLEFLNDKETYIVAGGTDLLVRSKLGIVQAKSLVDIKQLDELRYIKLVKGEGLFLGSATTIREIQESVYIQELYPVLAQAAAKIGSVQIRNMGTAGGNICQENMCKYFNQPSYWREVRKACYKAGGESCYAFNQKQGVCFSVYRGDLATDLIALDAKVRICRQNDEKEILLEYFFTGKGDKPNVLTQDSILKEIYIPIPRENSKTIYLKNSHRNAVDYPNVSVAIHATSTPDGLYDKVRIVMSGMQPGPVRLFELEKALENQTLKMEMNKVEKLAKINKAFTSVCKPILNNIPNITPKTIRIIAINLISHGLSKMGML